MLISTYWEEINYLKRLFFKFMTTAPILFFTYNRPSHTRQSLEALLNNELCSHSDIFIFSDGYKNKDDKQEVIKVRELIHSINGFRNISIIERNENYGLARNIIEGVTEIIDKYKRVIVLEDDLITSPLFLTFMNESLVRYKDEDNVGHVQGFCFPIEGLPDSFLIRWPGSWGWATWDRAWKQFNPDGAELLKEIKRRRLTKTFDFNGKYPFTKMLERQVRGENNSWAIRWHASLFLNNVLSLNAGKSLVQNIGFDGSGIHSGNDEIYSTSLYNRKLNTEVGEIKENLLARKEIEKYHGKTYSLWAKAKRRVNRMLRSF